MNIAFDVMAILGPMSKNRGIGNYAYNQFKSMIELDESNKYFCFNLLEESNDLFCEFNCLENFQEDYFFCGKDDFLLNNNDYSDILGSIIKNYINKNKIDIFYITSPFDSHIIPYKKEWFNDIKVVATVYDIIPYVMKEQYLSDKSSYNWYISCVNMIRWVDKLLVISPSVKDDLVKYLDFPESQIEVIWGGVDKKYKKIIVEDEDKKNLFRRFNIDSKFIMCPGGDDERKNISGLIKAYSKLPENLIDEYQLIIVCKLSSHSEKKYRKLICNLKIDNRVILTNFVSNDELIQLYNLAYLMAFPSKYEGFGLPIVEAWACETPVLTSNNSSLIQIAGDGAIIVDPFDINDITKGLKKALTENLTEIKIKGSERLNKFQWDNVANTIIDILNLLNYDNHHYLNEQKQSYKLAFFTPLPPIQSGISDYSVDILNRLSKYFDIDVFIDTGYSPNCVLNDSIKVFNHMKFSNHKYDYIIYQVGNSEYHKYMWQYIKKYRSIIVLHDYNLHNVARHVFLSQLKDKTLYKKSLLEDYDENTVNLYLDILDKGGKVYISKYELNGFLTNYTDKIIVHSEYAKEKLLLRNISRNVKVIPLYAKIEKLTNINNSELRQKFGISNDTFIFASFGHIHETKRALAIIKAFSKLIKEYDNIIYLFVGKLDVHIEGQFNSLICDLNIDSKVKVTGYINLEQFEEYIDLSDVCLNLRYPYNGENSGSLMRMLGKGKSVIINDIGSFKEIPNDACIKIPSVENLKIEEEINYIYMSMKKLMSDSSLKFNIERNARKYAEDFLDINKIIKRYKDFILNDYKLCLDRRFIDNIKENEIAHKYYTDNEIKKLSKTLAYSINFD